MGIDKIGFGAILSTEEEEWIPKYETVIECTECADKLYYKDFGPANSAFCCQCRNLRVGCCPSIGDPHAVYMTLTYGKHPKIYDISYEDYCKIKGIEIKKNNE